MTLLLAAAFNTLVAAGNLCTVSGMVVDSNGQAVPHAAVYLEQGLEGALLTTTAGADGAFRFEEVYPGVVGVFARQPGLAWGGTSISLGFGQSVSGATLQLRAAGSLSGRITAGKGKPVGDVRVTRVALLTENPVSIPYTKLRAFGMAEPVSDASGEFIVEGLPAGATVAIKLSHPDFAQARIDEAQVGSSSADVVLYEGVLVTGQVFAGATQRPVPQAVVSIRNSNPPHDTAIAVTDGQGTFGLRLLPGAYLYKAGGARIESGGWQPLLISGELPVKELTLRVAGTGEVTGQVLDAKTSEPIGDARVYLETGGAPAAIARSGPTGTFALIAMAGENTVRLEAAPGYLPPTTPATRFTVQEGETVELPVFWLAPLPQYTLRVVDANETALPGATVRLLRPAQIGWQRADDSGVARLGLLNLPADGRVVGMVEHPTNDEAALFALSQSNAEDAVVELFPIAGLSGRVVDGSGRAMEGAVVDGRLLDESFSDPILLWRTVTNSEGEFTAPLVPAQVGQIVVGYTTDEWGSMVDQSQPQTVVIGPGETKRLPDTLIKGASTGKSQLGKRLKWSDGRHLCGPTPPSARESGAAIVMYCRPAEAEATVASLEFAAEIIGDRFHYAVIVDGEIVCDSQIVHVLTGKPDGVASSYLLNASGEVVLETFGLPPLRVLRAQP